MKPRLISVVVPAYNEEEYLAKTLTALKSQDYKNFEIIVVNNNSTDETPKIAEKYADRVVFEAKQGLTFAREKGFAEARGEIIARTDADSMPGKDWLTQINNAFDKNPDAVALAGPSQFYDTGPLIKVISKVAYTLGMHLPRILMGHYQLNGSNFAIRKTVVGKYEVHDKDWIIHEDMDLSCHIRKYGRILFLPGILVDTSGRRLVRDPMFLWKYFVKSVNTYFLHHPGHKRHHVN